MIDRADLRGVGNVNHTRLHHMLVASVLPMSLYYFPDLVPFELSVPSRKSQDLVAGGLDRAGLVAVDMARIGGDHALPGLQAGSDDCKIRLGTAHQEMDLAFGQFTFFQNHLSGLTAVIVLPVAGGLLQIGFNQSLYDTLMSAFVIITIKKDHFLLFLLIKWTCRLPATSHISQLFRACDAHASMAHSWPPSGLS